MPAPPRPPAAALLAAVAFVAAVCVTAAPAAGAAPAQPPGGLPIPEGLKEAFAPKEQPDGPPVPAAVWGGTVDDRVTALAFSPDGATLAVGTFEKVELRNAADGAAVRTLKTRAGFVESLLWPESPDGGDAALTVGDYRRVTRWDPTTGRGISRKTGPRGYVTGLALAGGALLASSEDGAVWRWAGWGTEDEAKDAAVARPLNADGQVPARGLAAAGGRVAVAFGDPDRDVKPGPTVLLDAASLDDPLPLPKHTRGAECVAFSAGGAYVLTGGTDEVGRLSFLPLLDDAKLITGRAATDPKPIGRYAGHARPVNAVAAVPVPGLPDQDAAPVFATGSGGRAKGGNELRVWRYEPPGGGLPPGFVGDEERGEEETDGEEAPAGKVRDLSAVTDFAGPVRSLAVSADGGLLAVGDDSGAVRVYRVADLLGLSPDEPAADEETPGEEEDEPTDTAPADPEPDR